MMLRPGAPNTFNLEQITQLYAIACIHQNNMVVPSVIGAAEN
jgi:hypothetical protein